MRGQDDILVKVAPLLSLNPDWPAFLNTTMSENELTRLRATSEPVGPWATTASCGGWKCASDASSAVSSRDPNLPGVTIKYGVPGILEKLEPGCNNVPLRAK